MSQNNCIILDGSIVPADRPVICAESRGLMYGDGVFETFRTYAGHTFFLKKHLYRLLSGMCALGMDEDPQLEINSLRTWINELLRNNQLLSKDAIVRLQVWRDGSRGYLPQKSQTRFSITAAPCPASFSSPELVTVNRRRIPSAALPTKYKFTNGINYILSATEASNKDGDDALMQTLDGWISETTIANIFWAKGRTVFTPSEECDLLPGITRRVLMQLIEEEKDWQISQGKFVLDHLLGADAVWVCNSVRELLPVKRVDEVSFNMENDLFVDLKERFATFRDNKLEPLAL